jgi:3,4-dihydroxy 2-butanone 4-phosphate synthase / GTP cyclohydrolase II
MTDEPILPRVVEVSTSAVIRNRLGNFVVTAYTLEDLRAGRPVLLTLGVGSPVDGMLLRINSACITSEVFGDDRCDCSWQLWESMTRIQNSGTGLIIYNPNDEGRGVGIFQKILSFNLMDTYDCTTTEAFTRLGLPSDKRTYAASVAVLKHLGISRIVLLSNNPKKMKALEEQGIMIEQVAPLVPRDNPALNNYLLGKKRDFGHDIDLDT